MTTPRPELDDHVGQLERIERHFLGALSPRESEEVYDHVRGCPRCERAYERFASAERALYASGGERALSPASLDRVRDRLFEGAAPVVAPEPRGYPALRAALPVLRGKDPGTAGVREPRRPSMFGELRLLLGGALAAAVGLGIALVALPAGGPGHDGVLGARGGDGATLSPARSIRALRVYEGAAGGIAVEALARTGTGVRAGEGVKVLYSSLREPSGGGPAAPIRWVTAAFIGPGGRALAHLGPLEVETDAEDRGLGAVVPVSDTWPIGQVEIVAAFTAGPPPDPSELAGLTPADAPERSIRVVTFTVTAPVEGAR